MYQNNYFLFKYKGKELKNFLARVTDKHCGNKRYNVCVRVKAIKRSK